MLSIRFAQTQDAALLAAFIRELAEYDGLGPEAIITEDDITRDGFGPHPRFRVLIAEWDGQPAGYACFFDIYSTFQGRPGIFLDDIFVREPFRRKGIGKAMFSRVAQIAIDEDYFCVRWEVLNWNKLGIEFFENRGAVFLENEWKSGLLIGEALEDMAKC
jgi:GNAT superfamily N-acetyltransferase